MITDKNSTEANKNFIPFESIALCFSGGGFRAAAYCLGVLSYLNRIKLKKDDKSIPLINNINFTASASGGTILNLLYGNYLYKYKDEQVAFYKCFKKLYEGMNGETILENAVDTLADDSLWETGKTSKQRNIINSFSKVYDNKLFDSETFDIFWREPLDKDYSVCFNATEFNRGLSFRFQKEKDEGIFEKNGNKYIYFDSARDSIVGKIKLGDILAASSCFPAGFEPLIFPEDFAYTAKEAKNNLTVDELKTSLKVTGYDLVVDPLKVSIGLMDGGVDDNQALHSVMQADQRRINQSKKSFSLVMVNDVTSYFMTPYEVSSETTAGWGKENADQYIGKLNTVRKIYRLLPLIFVAIIILSVSCILVTNNTILTYASYFLLGMGSFGCLLLLGINQFRKTNTIINFLLSRQDKNFVRNFIQKKTNNMFSDKVLTKLLAYLRRAKFGNLKQLIWTRMNSIVTMAVEVNLKQIRRLIYSLFYENKTWDNKRVPNFIYELSQHNIIARKKRLEHPNSNNSEYYLSDEDKNILLDIKELIPSVAEEARTMGTTLWFGNKDGNDKKLDKLIQCGQFTTCVNLLEYTLVLKGKIAKKELHFSDAILTQLTQMEKDLKEDWASFIATPDFLFKEELLMKEKELSNN